MTDQTELEEVTTIDVLQKATIAALQGKTLAGYRIFAPRDWPTWDGEYPLLIILTPQEVKDREGLGTLLFDVRATIRVVGRVSATASEDDEGVIVALADLSTMQREIETHLIGDPVLSSLANVVQVRMSQGTRSIGQKHVGELIMDFDFTFNQGPEAFFAVPTVPLDSVRGVGDSGSVVDKTGAYPPPSPSYNVPLAPRVQGPDGREEGGFQTDNLQN